jgi:hypothetical protein
MERQLGIQDQIADDATGVLLDDAHDHPAYGAAVCRLLDDPGRAHAIGQSAQARVRKEFLAVRGLLQYVDLIGRLPG